MLPDWQTPFLEVNLQIVCVELIFFVCVKDKQVEVDLY